MNDASLFCAREETGNLQNFPETMDFYSAHSCFVVALRITDCLPYVYVSLTLITSISISCAVVMTACFRGLEKMKNVISTKTYKMHRSLVRALIVQVCSSDRYHNAACARTGARSKPDDHSRLLPFRRVLHRPSRLLKRYYTRIESSPSRLWFA